jgi:hypothetical protein
MMSATIPLSKHLGEEIITRKTLMIPISTILMKNFKDLLESLPAEGNSKSKGVFKMPTI